MTSTGPLSAAQLYWLVTVRRDGRPHAVPLCGVWHDGAFFFATGDEEQKMRNLEANQHVAVTAGPLGANGWDHGMDIVVEGGAERVTDEALLRTLADAWEVKYQGDWKWAVRDARFFELTHSGGGGGGGARGPTGQAGEGDDLRRRARPDHIPPLAAPDEPSPTTNPCV